MTDPVGAAIAFSALGANVLATGLLLLFNARSRAIRWYATFLTAISLWLLTLGVVSITGEWHGPWRTLYAIAVFALPGLFLASTLAQTAESQTWARWTAVGVTLTALPLGLTVMTTTPTPAVTLLGLAWQVLGWGSAAFLQWRDDRHHGPKVPERRRAYRVVSRLLVLPGIVVIAAMLLGGERFFRYVMPLVIIAIHFIIFAGVIWLRFYDIEVRAARTGDLAGRAVEGERLALVGELAASVAHEIRNPLTGVRSLAQRIAEEDVDPGRLRRYSTVIVEEIGRVDRIVANLLAVARQAPAVPRSSGPTDLAQLFDDLLLLTGARAARVGVLLEADAADLIAPVGREALAQVLLNLLLNAIRHTPEGGRVRLVAVERGPIEIAVRDSGPGVPAQSRDRIFEPFQTASTDGSGLGLSVVRRIARENGWTVCVGDAPEGGAEFRIALTGAPVVTASALGPADRPAQPTAGS